MLLMDMLNRGLNDLPMLASVLEKKISIQEWDNDKKEQAIKIVRQLKEPKLRNSNDEKQGKPSVKSKPLCLELTSHELEKISKEWDARRIMQYAEDLLADINKLSRNILLAYEGYDYNEDTCKIKIVWYI